MGMDIVRGGGGQVMENKIKRIKGFKWYNPLGDRLLGEYEVVGDGTVISKVHGSRLSCPNLSIEEELLEFLSMRVFPPSQYGLKQTLSDLGLREYDVEEIFIRTRGRMLTDGKFAEIRLKG